LITGENKAPVLKQIIKNEPSALNYPAAYIHDNKGNVDFISINRQQRIFNPVCIIFSLLRRFLKSMILQPEY